MLRIFKAPKSLSFGLEDRFSPKMEQALVRTGVPCKVKEIWPDFWTRRLYFGGLPYAYHLFRHVAVPIALRKHLQNVRSGDIVWMTGSSVPIPDIDCCFEKKVMTRGAAYVLWIEDDWFSDERLRVSAEARVDLADLIIAVTPMLKERIDTLYPHKRVVVLEEAIDVDRLTRDRISEGFEKPVLLWTGRPWNLKKLLYLDNLLAKVHRDIPFTLRIVTGKTKPEISLCVPWEWLPYEPDNEAGSAKGAVAGIAPLEDGVYQRCKGNYKVKTYMALGIPPLTSPIGYNNHLIRHGEDGFLLTSDREWELALRELLTNPRLAAKMGSAARDTITKRYSYEALMPIYADTLQQVFPLKAP